LQLVAHLTGPLRLETVSGVEITPKLAKARGLLLLLLTSPNGVRERAWLQDKLWSDRGRDQAAGSLRQTVFQCRAALGTLKHLITSDKLRIRIDLSQIDLNVTGRGILAEGLDVRDEEFEDWLRQERMSRPRSTARHMSGVQAPSHDLTLTIETRAAGGMEAEWYLNVFADLSAASLGQHFGAEVARSDETDPAFAPLRLVLHGVQTGDRSLLLRAILLEAATGRQLWAGHRKTEDCLDGPDRIPDMAQFIAEIVDTVRHIHSKDRINLLRTADVHCAKAIVALFSMTPNGLNTSEDHLRSALDLEQRAVYLAWKAQVLLTRNVERHAGNVVEICEESELLVAQARQLEPNQSTVLAIAANVSHYLRGNSAEAHRLAEMSVRANRSNAMAWWALSSAQLYIGEADTAYQSALMAKYLFQGSNLAFFAETMLGGAALAAGDHTKALQHFEHCHADRPAFRPAMRYAIGLNAALGHAERAADLVARLSESEQDFSPLRLLEDTAYPTRLLQTNTELDRGLLKSLG